jgi:hypothetical protein
LRTNTEMSYQVTHAPVSSWRSQVVRLARWAKKRPACDWPSRPAAAPTPLAASKPGRPSALSEPPLRGRA